MIKIILVLLFLVAMQVRPSLIQNIFDCGVPQVPIVLDAVVGGSIAKPGEWPWHVAIYEKIGEKIKYICGGTLVTKQHVITAEHCTPHSTIPHSETKILVRLGVHMLNSMDEYIQQRSIQKIYRGSKLENPPFRNDIAILELTTEVEFSKYVQPACLSLTRNLTEQNGIAIGWGKTESDTISNELKKAHMPVVDYFKCIATEESFRDTLNESLFCAGHTSGTTVCNGDSGGGIFFNENGAWYLGGTVAFSKPRDGIPILCDKKSYSVFTKIYMYLEWIKSVTKLNLPIDKDQCKSKDLQVNANYANLLPQNCATRKKNYGTHTQNVSNGLKFPWMAILSMKNNSELDGYCAGSLINKRYVLTSTSCTTLDNQLYQVRLGEQMYGQIGDLPVRHYGIECILRHPNAARTNNIWSNNIALVRLDQDVEFEAHIRPVCLPVKQSQRDPAAYEYLVTSWHRWNMGRPSALISTTVTKTPALCQGVQHLLCMTRAYGTKVCFMSVGSPLVFNINSEKNTIEERFVQFGILTHVSYCNFSFYVSIAQYMDWILVNLNP